MSTPLLKKWLPKDPHVVSEDRDNKDYSSDDSKHNNKEKYIRYLHKKKKEPRKEK